MRWRWWHSIRYACFQFVLRVLYRRHCCVGCHGAPLWVTPVAVGCSLAASQSCGSCCRAPAAEAEPLSMYVHVFVCVWCV